MLLMSLRKRKPQEDEASVEKIAEQLASLKATMKDLQDMLADPRLDDRRRKVVRNQVSSLTEIYEKLTELHSRKKN